MFIIYNKETTRLIGGSLRPKEFNTERAAKSFLTRISNYHGIVATGGKDAYAIADKETFHNEIEKWETVVNLMSRKPVVQRVNTPLCLDVSSETYWSM